MTDFIQHSIETAPEGSRQTLEAVTRNYGFLPNLIATFAESPAITKAYVTLAEILGESGFNDTEQQVILLTASRYHNCEYCIAAHSTISDMRNVPRDVVDSIREDQPIADPKLEALRAFTLQVVDQRGWVDENAIAQFVEAGYTKANVLEVILGISLKVLSNYTNHIAETPVDGAFAPNQWQAPA